MICENLSMWQKTTRIPPGINKMLKTGNLCYLDQYHEHFSGDCVYHSYYSVDPKWNDNEKLII